VLLVAWHFIEEPVQDVNPETGGGTSRRVEILTLALLGDRRDGKRAGLPTATYSPQNVEEGSRKRLFHRAAAAAAPANPTRKHETHAQYLFLPSVLPRHRLLSAAGTCPSITKQIQLMRPLWPATVDSAFPLRHR